MHQITNYGTFLVSGILLNITPGANMMYILERCITQGKKAGKYAVLGISSGWLFYTLLAAFGISVLLARSDMAFNLIRYLGGGYLLYLGIKMIWKKKNAILKLDTSISKTLKKTYFSGMLTNVTNPKVLFFFLIFLPRFVISDVHDPVPFLILGFTYIVTGTAWSFCLVLFSSRWIQKIIRKPGLKTWIDRIAGSIFILLSIKLLTGKK